MNTGSMTSFNFGRTESFALLCGAAAIFLGAMAFATWQQRTRKRRTPPRSWRRVGQVGKLSIYPLKSGQVWNLEEAECTDIGVRTTDRCLQKFLDRFLMAYDAKSGGVRTARRHPRMVLIKVSCTDGHTVSFEAPNMPVLKFDVAKLTSSKKICRMWHDEPVEAIDCGDEPAQWMCQYLQVDDASVRIGYYALDKVNKRDFSKSKMSMFQKVYKNLGNNDSGAYPDLATFMMINEESVAELRDRIKNLPGLNTFWFRPNIVVKGAEPYAENTWEWIRIGEDAIFQNVKPCTRCGMINLDPETGIKESTMEPLKTLKTYCTVEDPAARKLEGDSPVMGIYLGLRQAGIIQIGDPIYVGEY